MGGNRRSTKVNVGFLLIGFLGLIGSSIAYGAQAYSNFDTLGTVNGYSYENLAGIDNTNLFAWSEMATTNGVNVPVGYMGAAGHLWTASGTLCQVSGLQYNGLVANNFVAETTWGSFCGSGYYYSSGFTRAYNGSGYNTYATYSSPQLYF